MTYCEWKTGDLARGHVRIDEIREGGLGRVYIGYCLRRQMDVVIKTIRRDLWRKFQLAKCWEQARDDIIEERQPAYLTEADYFYHIFFREARLTCQAKGHPALVRGFNIWWTNEGQPFYECDYIDGQSLSDLYKLSGPWGALQLANLAVQFCNGMLYITEEMLRCFNARHPGQEATGFVHRDIKPENILVDQSNQIRIIDLGLAKFIQPKTATRAAPPNIGLCTPAYASPEQQTSYLLVEPSSDVYSLGATLFQLAGGEIEHLARMVDLGAITFPDHLPGEFRDILEKCLQRQRTARYQDFRELKRALVAFIEGVKAGRIRVPDGRYCEGCGFVWPEPQHHQGLLIPQPVAEEGPLAMEFVRVPAGPFWKGCREDQMRMLVEKIHQNPYDDEPYQQVELPGYEIGLLAVTNEQYLAFVRAMGHRPPSHWTTPVRPDRLPFPDDWSRRPVVNVSFEDAAAFCAWAGYRLPTGDEWEKAARGADGRLYPWGETYNPAFCNSAESGRGRPIAVDELSQGRSPYGCLHMTGNVFEWVDEPHPDDSRFTYLRGGCWAVSCEFLGMPFFHYIASRKDAIGVGERENVVGFRCARTPRRPVAARGRAHAGADPDATVAVKGQQATFCPVCRGTAVDLDPAQIKIPETNLFTWRGYFDLS